MSIANLAIAKGAVKAVAKHRLARVDGRERPWATTTIISTYC